MTDNCRLKVTHNEQGQLEFDYVMGEDMRPRNFLFDFMFYKSFEGQRRQGGIYVFKPSHQNPFHYNLEFLGMESFEGDDVSQILVKYVNPQMGESLVRIKLTQQASIC